MSLKKDKTEEEVNASEFSVSIGATKGTLSDTIGRGSYSRLLRREIDSPNDFLPKVDGPRIFTDKGRRTNT